MKLLHLSAVAIVTLLTVGCSETSMPPQPVLPAAPSELYTITGDNVIELHWNKSPGKGVAGYNVFVSSTYSGRYDLIGSAHDTCFLDRGAVNGNAYFYAVTAFDEDGNESPLSKDVVSDTPRPEGFGVSLAEYHQNPSSGGYDFLKGAVTAFDDGDADMYFERYQDTLFMNVRLDSDIQDLGSTNSLRESGTTPDGWSPSHDVVLQQGHSYAVRTWDDHEAKFRVSSLSTSRVVFDWDYQVRSSEFQVNHSSAERPPLVAK